jgi:hypothetical protein
MEITTRRQLRGYGLSDYTARKVTQGLTPTDRQGSTYRYSISDVISAIRQALQNSRLKASSKSSMEAVLNSLLASLDNIIPGAFGQSSDPELGRLAQQLVQSMQTTNLALANLEATAVTIKGKRQRRK